MIALESMIQSLRLAWIMRIFGANDGTWKSYLRHLLNRFGGLFLFHCNYDVKDIPITSQFYSELLKWWSDFREEFDTERDQQNIVWNNKEIRINNKPVFYKNFFESGIIYVNDLLFHLRRLERVFSCTRAGNLHKPSLRCTRQRNKSKSEREE